MVFVMKCSKCKEDGFMFLLEGNLCTTCYKEVLTPAVKERKKAVHEDRTCVYKPCGRVYSPDHPHQKLCSPECKRLQGNLQNAARRLRVREGWVREEYEPLICASPTCSIIFTPNTHDRRFHNEECRAEANRVRARERARKLARNKREARGVYNERTANA